MICFFRPTVHCQNSICVRIPFFATACQVLQVNAAAAHDKSSELVTPNRFSWLIVDSVSKGLISCRIDPGQANTYFACVLEYLVDP